MTYRNRSIIPSISDVSFFIHWDNDAVWPFFGIYSSKEYVVETYFKYRYKLSLSLTRTEYVYTLMNISFRGQSIPGGICAFSLHICSFISSSLKLIIIKFLKIPQDVRSIYCCQIGTCSISNILDEDYDKREFRTNDQEMSMYGLRWDGASTRKVSLVLNE